MRLRAPPLHITSINCNNYRTFANERRRNEAESGKKSGKKLGFGAAAFSRRQGALWIRPGPRAHKRPPSLRAVLSAPPPRSRDTFPWRSRARGAGGGGAKARP